MKQRTTILLLLTALCLPAPSSAAVDWLVEKTMETKTAITAMATSFDGKNFFVLTKAGELLMLDEAGVELGSLKVAPGMDRIFLSGFQKAGVPEQLFVANSSSGRIQQLSFSLVAQIDVGNSPFLGNPAAPVALVVFSDFQ
jgi:protein-disulfide isomerase